MKKITKYAMPICPDIVEDYVIVHRYKREIWDAIKWYLDRGYVLYGSPFSGEHPQTVSQAVVKLKELEGK